MSRWADGCEPEEIGLLEGTLEALSLLVDFLNEELERAILEWKKDGTLGHSAEDECRDVYCSFCDYMDKAKYCPPSPRVKELCTELEEKLSEYYW